MGIKERRERERAARRSMVLDATRSLVRERGFNGTTTKQIAERSELSEATLFWYFKSKDEIFVSLLFESIEFMTEGLESIRSSDALPSEKLYRVWAFFNEVQHEHPEYFQVFSNLAHSQSTMAVTDDVKTEIRNRSGDNFRLFATLLEETIGTPKARLVADVMWGAMVGLVILRDSRLNLGAKAHPSEREMKEAFEILLKGIAPELAQGDRA